MTTESNKRLMVAHLLKLALWCEARGQNLVAKSYRDHAYNLGVTPAIDLVLARNLDDLDWATNAETVP